MSKRKTFGMTAQQIAIYLPVVCAIIAPLWVVWVAVPVSVFLFHWGQIVKDRPAPPLDIPATP